MELLEMMKQRHSVRQYTTEPIQIEKRELLNKKIEEINQKSGLSIQIFYEEPDCFQSFLAHYGSFRNVSNYIVIVGKDTDQLDELAGYYGEELVLYAQSIGLNTCWVALTHGKTKAIVKKDEKVAIVISIGIGVNAGYPHKNKSLQKLSKVNGEAPDWFNLGMEAVLLAPTALNQQKFLFTYDKGEVIATSKFGPYSKLDLGIVKYHFEAITNHQVK